MFSHGWPLNADAWESQMVFLKHHGYRCIAHDRRGHGRSGQPTYGNEMDTYAAGLSDLIEALDMNNTILVGHSAGGGEVSRHVGRHGTQRVAKIVLVGAVSPLMLKTGANPGGLAMEVFDGIRASVSADRAQFYKDLTTAFFGANRPDAKVKRVRIQRPTTRSLMAKRPNEDETRSRYFSSRGGRERRIEDVDEVN